MKNERFLPKFSIITVTYNADKTLEDTILSIITQTYKQVEYIIVDGASTDHTLQIIERYRNHIHTVVSEPDRGLYDAMNKGLQLATGDYVCFLNAGDCLHEANTLQNIVHSVFKSECLHSEMAAPDVIYGETHLVDSNRHFVRMRRLSTPERLTWKSFRKGMLVCHQAFFARLAIARTIPYDLDYRFSADFDWCIRVMKQSHILHNTHLTLIDYLDEGLTTRNHKASLRERFRIMCRHYGTISTFLYHLWFAIRLLTHPERV